jgi:hypothetical protein
MHAPMPLRKLAFAGMLVLCLVLAMPAAGLAETTTTPKYTEESKQAFEQQLEKGEIKSAEFNKRIRSLHIKTKNGTLYLYRYERKGSPAVESKLKARHVTFTVLGRTAAEQEAKSLPKTTKHKIRYIVGGVVLLLIVIGLVVYFVRRGRMRD